MKQDTGFRAKMACLLWMTLVSSAGADRMVLDNNDVLHGTLVDVEDGQVTFTSEYLGTLSVPYERLVGLTTDRKVLLHLEDGKTLEQVLIENNPGPGLCVRRDNQIQSVPLEKVRAIHPIPPQEAKDKSTSGETETATAAQAPNDPADPEKQKASPWTGSLNSGLTSVHGNSRTSRYNVSLNLNRRVEKTKAALDSEYARALQRDAQTNERTVNEDWWKIHSKLSYYFTPKNYSYIDGRYETDRVAHLKRRVALGAGAGYQVLESDQVALSVDVGGASLREDHGPDTEGNSSELSLQIGYDFDLTIENDWRVCHHLICYPNGRQWSDYYLTGAAEIRKQLTDRMFANMKGIINYDAIPASNALSTDIKYIFGVGINF